MDRWRRVERSEDFQRQEQQRREIAKLGEPGNEHRHRDLLPALTEQQHNSIHKINLKLMQALGVPAGLVARGGYTSNPSLCRRRGNNTIALAVRMHVEETRHSELLLGAFDENAMRPAGMFVSTDRTGIKTHTGMSSGVEDARLFEIDGVLHASVSASNRIENNPKPQIGVCDFDKEGHIGAVHMLPSPRMEKNWMPVLEDRSDGMARFVYSVDPLVVLEYDTLDQTVTPDPAQAKEVKGTIRGGSGLIPYEDGWLALVHESHAPPDPAKSWVPTYLQRFVYFDRKITKTRLSAPFYFVHSGIEFGSGLLELSNGDYLMTFGIDDIEKGAFMAVATRETIAKMVDSSAWVDSPAPPAPVSSPGSGASSSDATPSS